MGSTICSMNLDEDTYEFKSAKMDVKKLKSYTMKIKNNSIEDQ